MITILTLFVICTRDIINLFKKDIYSVDSRINNIQEEIKKDDVENYSTIGWLRVQGTNIDTPILYLNYTKIENDEDDDDYYGSGDITVDKQSYLWNNIYEENLLNKINIQGHNILNLSEHPDIGLDQFSRFDDLMAFVYYDFAKENKYIQYTANGKDYIYAIFSVEFVKDSDLDTYVYENYSKKEMKKNIRNSIENSLYKYNIKVNENDKIISLITCTRMFGDNSNTDFVVNAKLVEKNKKLKNYSIRKTKKYKEIESILESEVEKNEA